MAVCLCRAQVDWQVPPARKAVLVLKRVPVLRGNELVGIVTRANLVRALASMGGRFRIPLPMTTIFITGLFARWKARTGSLSAFKLRCVMAWFTWMAWLLTKARGGLRLSQLKTQ